MTQVIDEYARMEREEVRLLKATVLEADTNCQNVAFL